MATYAYRSISERQKIQSLWESGASVKEIAQDFDLSVSAFSRTRHSDVLCDFDYLQYHRY